MTTADWVDVASGAAATVPAWLRWLRVAQREHYLAGAVSRFALRWWGVWDWRNGVGLVAAIALLPVTGVGLALVVALGPLGLGVRGRTSPLAWTRRLRTLAVTTGAIVVAATAIAAVLEPWLVPVVALAVPLVVDLALWVLAPVERRSASRFVAQAAERLRAVDPIVVAITGSYGKTTVKHHVAQLVAGARRVVASPASFNNRAGLSRAVNEHLAPGTEVFVAEMGAYGPGEIADLCRWVQPSIGVVTAIGPVHLERFGSLDRTLAAKREILTGVDVAVLNVDSPGLAAVAREEAAQGTRVVRCSEADPTADVHVVRSGDSLTVTASGHTTTAAVDALPGNVACAVGIALAIGMEPDDALRRLPVLDAPAHRQQVVTAPSGVVVIDDTFNANPAGAAAALDRLRHHAGAGRRVVVTPGMIELGPEQVAENLRLGEDAARLATHLLVVGRTNRAALRRGAAAGDAEVVEVATRDHAVAWVREHLSAGDVVLYENDLPDHYA